MSGSSPPRPRAADWRSLHRKRFDDLFSRVRRLLWGRRIDCLAFCLVRLAFLFGSPEHGHETADHE